MNKKNVCRWISRIAMFVLLIACSVSVYADTSGKLTAKLNASETTCNISFSDYQMPADGEELLAAVWSAANDQDDLKWRELKASGGSYSLSFPISEHRSAGDYAVHLYLNKKNGQMVFLNNTVFTVASASATSVTVKDLNRTAGTCKAVISGLTSPSGVTKVQVPVWSKADQSDIVWYEASKQADGSWAAQINFAKHGNNIGTYQIHVYATSANGVFNFVGKTTVNNSEHDPSVPEAEASVNGATCTVKTTGLSAEGGIKNVKVAVWSSEGGQDDLHWTDCAYDAAAATATGSISLNQYRDFGTYLAHVYAETKTGKLVFQAKTEFEVSAPKADKVEASFTNGKFNINITGLSCGVGIDRVMAATWCAANQSDIVWYKTVKQADGSYTCSSDISKHQNHMGEYNVHIYAYDDRGSKGVFVGKTTFKTEMERTAGDLQLSPNADRTVYNVSIPDVHVPEAYASIQMAVWTDKNGQDDLKWYKAAEANATCTASIPISDHNKETGLYHLHLYAKQSDGTWLFIRKYTFEAEAAAADTIHIEKKSDTSAEVTVTLGSGKTAKDVKFPTWCAANQSDIVWYEASKQSDGSYKAVIDTANHSNHSGTYIIHTYYTDASGKLTFLNKGSVELTGKSAEVNTLTVNKTSDSTAEVSIRLSADSTAVKVEFPTWCAANQSDIVWYQGVKQSDGSYKAVVDTTKHQYHSGTYIVHAYAVDAAGKKTILGTGSVDLKSVAPEVIGPAGITSCLITGPDEVTVTANVSGSGTYGVFVLGAGQTAIASNATPLGTTTGSGTITIKVPLQANTTASLINAKLVIGQKQGGSYVAVSSGYYITNPEAIATNTRAFPTAPTKKGLQVNLTMAGDAADLGVNHSVINVVLSNLPCQSGGISYNYNGKTWHMDMGYVYALDQLFAEQAANGSIVSAVLLMPWDAEWQNLIIPSGRAAGHSFYGLNAEETAAREQLAAIFSFLANRYSDSGHNVVNWILGNEVDDFTDYNWCGNIGLQEYAADYAHAFRLLYNSVKSQYSNARVYISLDHVWNYPRSYGFKGMDLFNAFVNELKAEGDINWNIAFHPYPNPITSPNFWKNRQGVTNSSSSSIFTMLNLSYLTEYIKNTYGAQHRFILSETGFTSYSGGVHDEKLQAAAIAYGYYLAESNDMVDSFVVHRHVDHPAETGQGLYLGLWYTSSPYDEVASSKKFSWTVFKYMDTHQGAAYTNFALPIIGADSWSSIVPGYSAARYS